MSDLAKRLERLERASAPGGLADLLSDELFVMCMDAARSLLAADPEESGASEDDLAGASETIARTEAMIREAGERERSAGWDDHVAYVSGLRKDAAPFVPSVIGWDYDDWHHHDVMERRAALRARPDIARLLTEGAGREAA